MFDRYYSTKNIIVGDAELIYSPRLSAWILPGGGIIKSQTEAINYACKLESLIAFNKRKIKK